MVFPVVTYWCESWTMKKVGHWKIDVFELWCCRRLLRVPWTTKRSNLPILKEINPEYSLEGLNAEAPILGPPDLKIQLIGKQTNSLKNKRQMEKGAIEDELVGWHHWNSGHDMSKLWEIVKDNEAWRAAVHVIAKSQTLLSNWTTAMNNNI